MGVSPDSDLPRPALPSFTSRGVRPEKLGQANVSASRLVHFPPPCITALRIPVRKWASSGVGDLTAGHTEGQAYAWTGQEKELDAEGER